MKIDIISAGAGSGKTYRLTQDLVRELQSGTRARGIIATTFTRKAAAELQERVRVRLLEEGLKNEAEDLAIALIGTVHSVCGRILERFAFQAGVSPLLEIIADEDQQFFFKQSLSQVLSPDRIERMNLLSDRLGFNKSVRTPTDWRKDVQTITELARSNAFTREDLERQKVLTWAEYEAFLPEAEGRQPDTAVGWNNRLVTLLDEAIENLKNGLANDTTKSTTNALAELRGIKTAIQRKNGQLDWYEWAKLSKLAVGAKSKSHVEDLKDFARQVENHPLFREDLREMTFSVFEIASDALREYTEYKRRRGLIDYGDLEAQTAKLLEDSHVQEALRSEIDLLLVDEFQDTSPIQLDIFIKLSRLAKKAIWVGDPKQSIYGFRGAEPALMQAVLEKTGGVKPENILKRSWRSRQDLVNAANAIFVRAFDQMEEDLVALIPERTKEKEPANIEDALIHWHFKSAENDNKKPGGNWLSDCIADEVAKLIESGLHIQPKGSSEWIPVRPGDICILTRTNTNATTMAECLHRAGVQATIARAGLLETIEIRMLMACLRLLLNPADALSAAELKVLACGKGLSEIVESRLEFLATKSEEDREWHWAREDEFVSKLLDFRSKTLDLSASEIVDLVLTEMDLRRIILTYGIGEQRLANIDVLRQLARSYEDACQRTHSAASLGGFFLWLDRLVEGGRDSQASEASLAAVQVMTYHRSKGLEFPVVICTELETELKTKLLGVSLVNEAEDVDLNNILAHRRIRYWINPFSDQKGNTRFETALELHPAQAEATAQALAEETRLLYVGLTRARDFLIIPSTIKPTTWLNRTYNKGDESMPTFQPGEFETPFYYPKGVKVPIPIRAETIFKEKTFGAAAPSDTPSLFHAQAAGRGEFLPLYVDCYMEIAPITAPTLSPPLSFGIPPSVSAEDEADLAKILRYCLLMDWEVLPREYLEKNAERMALLYPNLEIEPQSLVTYTQAFAAFLQKKYKPTHIQRSVPVRMEQHGRYVEMSIDLLMETEEGVVLLSLGPDTEGLKRVKQVGQAQLNALLWAGLAFSQQKSAVPLRYGVVLPMDGSVLMA